MAQDLRPRRSCAIDSNRDDAGYGSEIEWPDPAVAAPKSHRALEAQIYADDYLLVRPNGDTFRKQQILADLRHHSMRFTSFEVNDVFIRTKGFVGILTAAVRSTAVRDGVEIKTHARQVAILSKENGRITISHFQSTNVVDR